MSLVSMGSIAVSRDLAEPGEPLTVDIAAERKSSSDGGVVTTPVANVGGFGQLLIAQIPTEALIGYTTLMALFTATPKGFYDAGRWMVYAAAIVICVLAVFVGYLVQRSCTLRGLGRTSSTDRSAEGRPPPRIPYLPMITSSLSMAVYGLVVPGSPLAFTVSPPAFAILSACLAVGGGVMMSIFAPFLGRGNAAVAVKADAMTGDSARANQPRISGESGVRSLRP